MKFRIDVIIIAVLLYTLSIHKIIEYTTTVFSRNVKRTPSMEYNESERVSNTIFLF